MEDGEPGELAFILMDEDAEAALAFAKRHFKGKAREVLEGARKVMIQVPGAGIRQFKADLLWKRA